MKVQAIIIKMLLLSLALPFCLHASSGTSRIGWKEALKEEVAREVAQARDTFLNKLGIKAAFEQVKWQGLAQESIKQRDQNLAKSKTPLIDPSIPEHLLDLITRRCAKFNLDLDSLQIASTNETIGGASLASEYVLRVNPKELSPLTNVHICWIIDHEIHHWLNRHPLEMCAILNICNLDYNQLNKYEEYELWCRSQEKQADILAILGDKELAQAAQTHWDNIIINVCRKLGISYENLESNLDVLIGNLPNLKRTGNSTNEIDRIQNYISKAQGKPKEHPDDFERWYYFKKLTDKVIAGQKESSSSD